MGWTLRLWMVWSGRRSGSWAHLEPLWSLGNRGSDDCKGDSVTDTDTSDSQQATDWFNPLCILYSFILACVFHVICWSQIVLFPMKWPTYCSLEDASRRWVLGGPKMCFERKRVRRRLLSFPGCISGQSASKINRFQLKLKKYNKL